MDRTYELSVNDELYRDAVLRNYGVEVRDEKNNYRPFVDVINELRTKWNSLLPPQRKAIIQVLVGDLEYGK